MVFRSRSVSLAVVCGAWILSAPLFAVAQTPEPPPSTISVRAQFIEDRAPVPYELDNGLLFFNAMIGDTPVRVLLDNGADLSVIDATLAQRLGFRSIPLNRALTAADGQQRPQILAQNIPFRIPGQLDVASSMLVVDLKPISSQFDRSVDVVLGSEFFALAIAVDRSTGTIAFAPSGGANFDNAISVPLSADDVVDAKVADQPVRLELDLGANSGASLYPDVFARVLPGVATTEGRSMAAFGGTRRHKQAQNIRTSLGDLGLTGPVSETALTEDGPDHDGRLGSAMFQFFSVIFDRTAGKLLIQAPLALSATTPAGPMSGAEMRRRWNALMARPGPEVMSSPETPRLIGAFQSAATAYRADVRATAAAGAPRACPPEQAELSPNDIVARIAELPEAEQAEDFPVVLGRIFDARYPCPAAA